MPDRRDARRAFLPEPRLEPVPRLFRGHLVVRRVQRRVDGDESDELVRVFEDPKSRGGRASVMGLDVREVYASENVLGRVFYIRSVFPKSHVSGMAKEGGAATAAPHIPVNQEHYWHGRGEKCREEL